MEWQPYLRITPLRTNPIYSNYNNWSRLLILGILPFLLLVFFNVKIYSDVKERRKRQLTMRNGHRSPPTDHPMPQPPVKSLVSPDRADLISYLTLPGGNSRAVSMHSVPSEDGGHFAMELQSLSSVHNDSLCPKDSWKGGMAKRTMRLSVRIQKHGNALARTTLGRVTRSNPTSGSTRRKNEDSMAVIFMGIILIFLVCHFPRILLNIYELATIHRSLACESAQRPQFSLWSLMMISISHVLLVVNSATNMIVYCLLSPKFRAQFKKSLLQFLGQELCAKSSGPTVI